MTWTQEEWSEAVASPDWGERVAEALKQYFESGKPLLAHAELVSVNLEADPDGIAVLKAVYRHPQWPERTGLRRRLDQVPFSAQDEESPEGSKAATIAIYEISEPLGSYRDRLVEDTDGVLWWGDGYAVGEGL